MTIQLCQKIEQLNEELKKKKCNNSRKKSVFLTIEKYNDIVNEILTQKKKFGTKNNLGDGYKKGNKY